MDTVVMKIDEIKELIKPLAEKYNIENVYVFGSYARGEALPDSDVDFLVFGGEGFKLTNIFAFAEEVRRVLDKKADVFEIHEIDQGSDFYNAVMKEKVLVA